MKRKKLTSLLCAAAVTTALVFPFITLASQPSDNAAATQTGTPDQYVELIATNNLISYGTLNISSQAAANQRTGQDSTKYVIFESQYDLSSADTITFNEGTTNSNAFYKVTYTGETYPENNGLDNTSWLFFRDSEGNGYIQSKIQGTLTNGGGEVAMPKHVTEIGSFSSELVYYTSSDSGVTWTRNTKTIYVALGNNGQLYTDDVADLSSAQSITAKGGATSDAFEGNNMVLSNNMPTQANDDVTLEFGWYVAWDATQGNSNKSFYTLVDMPQNAATGHAWKWHITITGEYHSNP